MKKFQFTAGQRQELIAAGLKQFPVDQTEVFLNEAQRITGEWLSNYPTRHGSNKKSRERLEMLAKQLEKTRHYLLLLPELARLQLGMSWNLKEIELSLLEFQQSVTETIQPSGITKSIEGDLIESLAWAFVDTYSKRPTTSPAGPFMNFMKNLSENVLIPTDVNRVTFGKALIAGVLRHVKSRLDEYDKHIMSSP